MRKTMRAVALALAGVAGTAVRTLPGLAGAVAVTWGVQRLAGWGWALISIGAFCLVAAWEQNRAQPDRTQRG